MVCGSFATTCLPFAKAFIISSNCYHIHLGLGSVTRTEVGRLHQIQQKTAMASAIWLVKPSNGLRLAPLVGQQPKDSTTHPLHQPWTNLAHLLRKHIRTTVLVRTCFRPALCVKDPSPKPCVGLGGHLRDAGFRQSTINQTLRVTTKTGLSAKRSLLTWVTYGIVYHRVLQPLLVRFKRRWV